jgi:hypothetical protein
MPQQNMKKLLLNIFRFPIGVIDTSGAPQVVNVFANFDQIRNLAIRSWACGKMIHEKNPLAKNLVTRSI